VSRVNKADGLRAVDRLGECAMKEGVLDIELVDGPTPRDSQSQHSPDGGRLDDVAEGLIIVHRGCWMNPRRTKRALYQSIEPSSLSLCLKIHLSVTTLAQKAEEPSPTCC
jgi:hypothetical protein